MIDPRTLRTRRLLVVPAVFLSLSLAAAGRPAPARQDAAAVALTTLEGEGQVIYARDCASCHGAEGNSDGAGPALDANTNLQNKDHVLKRILGGSPEKGMEAFGKTLTDREIAAVATYVRNAWNNADGIVLESEVKTARAALPKPR